VSDRFTVVFAGGGTGGHLYPAIAIAQALGKHATVAFIGTADRLESRIVPKAGYPLDTVRSRPLTRGFNLGLIATVFANAVGVLQAMHVLARRKPDILIATGGYVCFPVVLAARILRALGRFYAPIALLEPNAQPGLTNRMLAPLVDEVWGAFGPADSRFAGKYVHTGVPVRASLRDLPSREKAIERLGLSPKRRTLFAMGGSQGARSINDALSSLLLSDGLPEGWQLFHVTGEKEFALRTAQRNTCEGDRWIVRPYLDDLSDAYAAADLVLARAGASTLGELAATRRPAILVPYPYAADDHQYANAAELAKTGAAILIDDRQLNAGKLPGVLADATQPSRLAELQARAKGGPDADPVTTILARVELLRMRKKRT
jgi:UDP-N-acetylglucosamine--N-acetylmuramyl-(pentapeptide) pyrophosphoryl-undecaprenol N-acetylglucosamine transferase